MITVIDPEAARRALATRNLACPEPGCTGRLRVWSKARPRPVRGRDGRVQVIRPDRGRCRACSVTQVLLPAFCLPRCGYRVEVVGAVLLAAADGASYAHAGAACAVPTSTVRDWIRAVRRSAPALIAHTSWLPPSAPDPAQAWPTPSPRLPGLTAALHALGTAARGLASWLTRPDPPAHATVTGIDYLALIARQHRHEVLRRLRLAAPSSGAGHATPWELVTILTAGRLLTGVPG